MTFKQKISYTKFFLLLDSKNKTSGHKNTKFETVFKVKDDWRQNKNFKNLPPGATKNSLNATKRIIKKAFLELKLSKFECFSWVPTKLPHKKIIP